MADAAVIFQGRTIVTKRRQERTTGRLTVKRIDRLKQKPGRYPDGDQLYLCVGNENNQSWKLRYERDGREHWLGLGPLRTVGLKDARERAKAARLVLLDGVDPIEKHKADKAAKKAAATKARTFAEVAQQYFDAYAASWTNERHRAQFTSTMAQYVNPVIGGLVVAAVDTAAVLRVLEQAVPGDAKRGLPSGTLWAARPATADRVRNRVEAVLDWASVRGHRSGDNPARWQGFLELTLPARSKTAKAHHAALDYHELPKFMAELRAVDSIPARALQFAILTAARTGEVLGATWDEIDLPNAVWVIPASRMKARKDHKVLLAPAVVALLGSLPREYDRVFTGPSRDGGLSGSAMPKVLKRLAPGVTAHGMRSCFADWAHEQTAYAHHAVEISLAHAIGSSTEQAYRRGDMLDKRRELMTAWCAYCESPPVAAGANVVPIRA